MSTEELREVAQEIRSFAEWARGEVFYTYVEISRDLEFDLGQFGYRETEVTVADDEYPLEAEHMVNQSPLQVKNFEEIADLLDKLADEMDATPPQPARYGNLTDALAGMAAAVAQARELLTPAVDPDALPPSPLPWPGALREDIDYTADDFPKRYQPPPGYAWDAQGLNSAPDTVDWQDAKCIAVGFLKRTNQMVLDKFGRVSWHERWGDDFAKGVRWPLWHVARDGIPNARGFTGTSPPRALDQNGLIIPEPHTEGMDYGIPVYNWETEGEAARAVTRVEELRRETPDAAEVPAGSEEFEAPAEVSL